MLEENIIYALGDTTFSITGPYMVNIPLIPTQDLALNPELKQNQGY